MAASTEMPIVSAHLQQSSGDEEAYHCCSTACAADLAAQCPSSSSCSHCGSGRGLLNTFGWGSSSAASTSWSDSQLQFDDEHPSSWTARFRSMLCCFTPAPPQPSPHFPVTATVELNCSTSAAGAESSSANKQQQPSALTPPPVAAQPLAAAPAAHQPMARTSSAPATCGATPSAPVIASATHAASAPAAILAAAAAAAQAPYPPPKPPRVWHTPVIGPQRPEDKGKKTLVLDLDETLVHSSFRPVANPDYIIPVEIEGRVIDVYVIKRPWVDHFLATVGQRFEVGGGLGGYRPTGIPCMIRCTGNGGCPGLLLGCLVLHQT